MLIANNLSLSFGEKIILEDVSFRIVAKNRIGLTGINGSGKTTLLKIITKAIKPDSGSIRYPAGYSIGYLPQMIKRDSPLTVLQEANLAFEEQHQIEKEIEALHKLIETTSHTDHHFEKYLSRLSHLEDRFHFLGGGQSEIQTEKVLKGLGFKQEDFQQPYAELSGGWKMRVELAKILLKHPDLILLDEPTNHLDIYSIKWLEQFLQKYPGSLMLVSHDRAFLDAVTNITFETIHGRLSQFKGSFSAFERFKKGDYEKTLQAKKQQDKYIQETQILINKFRAKKNKAAFAQSLIHKLERLEKIELPEAEDKALKIHFPPPPRPGKVVIKATQISKYYGDKHVLDKVNFELNRGEIVAFVGKNGEGKSTFARILSGQESFTGSVKPGHLVNIGFFAQDSAESLNGKISVLQTLEELGSGLSSGAIRSLLGTFRFSKDDVDKKVKVLSGGEKTRLALARLMMQAYNVLILDEPTNHLDMRSRDILKSALKQFKGSVIVISHDRSFLDTLAEKIYEFDQKSILTYLGDIQYFFLKNPHFGQAVSTDKQAKKKKEKNNNQKQLYEQKKALRKQERILAKKVHKTEQRIKQISTEINDMNTSMANSTSAMPEAFYNDYTLKKQALEQAENQWADDLEQLESIKEDLKKFQEIHQE